MDGATESLLAQIVARLEAIEAKLDRARPDKAEALVESFGTLAERLPVLADAAGGVAGWVWEQAEARGVDPLAAAVTAAELGLDAARPQRLAIARAALDALDGLDPQEVGAALRTAVALLELPELRSALEATATTTALEAVSREARQPRGLWALVTSIGDLDVQRALSFGLALAKRFGAALGR